MRLLRHGPLREPRDDQPLGSRVRAFCLEAPARRLRGLFVGRDPRLLSKEIRAMSTEENKTVVRRFFEELLSTDNLAVADELLSPDFYFYFAGSPDPMDLESCKGFLAARREAFPDRRFVVEDMIAEGEKVSARFTMRGTHKGELRGIAPSGREV